MNEKGILKSGNTTLEKRDSGAIFRKCISNIWIVSRNLLWNDFSRTCRAAKIGTSGKRRARNRSVTV